MGGFYSFFDIPTWVYDLWGHRKQYIGQLEILGALCVYMSLPECMLVSRDVVHWIDNTSAMASLFKGYTKVSDSSRMIHLFHLLSAQIQFTVWWEYVASAANISDLPSRLMFDLVISIGACYIYAIYYPIFRAVHR